MIDRIKGSLLGLACGDALGTTLEFTDRSDVEPIDDMVGGGPFNLEPGQWTDDTSLALCLADSLIEWGRFEPVDQLERYCRWRDEGYNSSTGECFDIGNTTNTAFNKFQKTGEPFPGPTDPDTAGNGSLMRLAPVALFYSLQPKKAIKMAGKSSRTTHGTQEAVDACRYFAGLLVGALQGADKEELLSPLYSPVEQYWQEHELADKIREIAEGSYKNKDRHEIGSTGYVVDSLEVALWGLNRSDDFRVGALDVVNLGGDADTNGAIYGQIAGAYYGDDDIPDEWIETLAEDSRIAHLAESLADKVPLDG